MKTKHLMNHKLCTYEIIKKIKIFISYSVLIIAVACSPNMKDCIVQDKDIKLFKDEIFERPFVINWLEVAQEKKLDTLSNPERNLLTVFIDSVGCLHINRVIDKPFKNKEDLFEYFITNPDKRDDFPDSPENSLIVFYSSKHADYERHKAFVMALDETLTKLFRKHLEFLYDFNPHHFFWSATKPYPKEKKWASPCTYDNKDISLFFNEIETDNDSYQYHLNTFLKTGMHNGPILPQDIITVYIDTLACLHINKALPNSFETNRALFEYLLLNPDKRDDLPKNPKDVLIIVCQSKFLDNDTYLFFVRDFFIRELTKTYADITGIDRNTRIFMYPTPIYPKDKE